MKKILFSMCAAVAAIAMFTSCGNKTGNNASEEVVALSVDTIIANPEAFVGDTVTVEGVVSHICKHGGRKAFLLGNTDNALLRCEATAEMGGAFPQESIHQPMRVVGVVVEQRTTAEDVDAMEAQHAEQIKMIAEQAGQEQADAVANAATGCDTERAAMGQGDIDRFDAQMADYRARIAERGEKEGKPYLSSYYIETYSYEILPE